MALPLDFYCNDVVIQTSHHIFLGGRACLCETLSPPCIRVSTAYETCVCTLEHAHAHVKMLTS